MFFRSELNAVAKAGVISTLPAENTQPVVKTTEITENAYSVPGLLSYIAIVLFATMAACIIAHYGDSASSAKMTDIDQPVFVAQQSE